jgi:hypothetical protein
MTVLVQGSSSVSDFLKAVRMSQDRLVTVYEIYLKERNLAQFKETETYRTDWIFVQPFFTQPTLKTVRNHF